MSREKETLIRIGFSKREWCALGILIAAFLEMLDQFSSERKLAMPSILLEALNEHRFVDDLTSVQSTVASLGEKLPIKQRSRQVSVGIVSKEILWREFSEIEALALLMAWRGIWKLLIQYNNAEALVMPEEELPEHYEGFVEDLSGILLKIPVPREEWIH